MTIYYIDSRYGMYPMCPYGLSPKVGSLGCTTCDHCTGSVHSVCIGKEILTNGKAADLYGGYVNCVNPGEIIMPTIFESPRYRDISKKIISKTSKEKQ